MILIFPLLFSAKGQNVVGFDTMVNTLLNETVDTLSSGSLSAKLESENIILLDARESDEFKVSHLPQAINIGYDNFSLDELASVSKGQTIVVYCSVGKRSEDIGVKLMEAGFTDVFNLYGGIFDWTNNGFKVVDETENEVKQVHPYNALWGFWVNNYEKRYEPR